ncbi:MULTISPECIES: Y-family DNA polymerase [unclassified Tenacibaculum]|uniref:Y-family DNA polymerase n=1 Tax=unclassified Tenacibaculum TaxID=2635139 RepID=UPI001F36E6CC|nr:MULTISPECIES: Y-family DNA polymerase [unclassified Tenacibaculum]MCF2874464.1 Y-family DNA polymerase [Tenacibaculum sp. Cn5-1]MCF2934470.1 Y-family DNA polymerase [Tenacibaculum sp. Cn5-34]MCG7510680.1 Y-family DNA polymerase [Tenacibaculum sp. Cn5-46]
MYALVDCNNFYTSCERVFNPNLEGKPVAILSNNDGCVISMSDEAKKINLPFGAPIFKWEQFCKDNNISVLSSNYPLYGDMSARVMKILEQFSPDVEVYSIDEAFLQFKGFDNYDFDSYGKKIRSTILQWTGIPTCVGLAPTKALSKIANKIARKFPKKTGGVYVIDSEEKRIKALQWIPIESVWGIGRGLVKKLKAKGCIKAYDFTQLDDDWVRKNLSITVWKLKKDLEGDSKIILDEPVTKKAIATTRSFEYTFSDIDNIKERISTFATSCAEKLRKQNSSCHMVVVMLRSDRHKKDSEQHRVSKTVVFPYPTDSTLTISKSAVKAVTTIFKEGIKYKRAGVIVTGLVPSDNYQLNMFEGENPKHKPLMKAIDKLNKTFKSDKVKLANQDLKRTWKMRQERLSPKYTTNINEIIKVK